jgi:hypothetical protein
LAVFVGDLVNAGCSRRFRRRMPINAGLCAAADAAPKSERALALTMKMAGSEEAKADGYEVQYRVE